MLPTPPKHTYRVLIQMTRKSDGHTISWNQLAVGITIWDAAYRAGHAVDVEYGLRWTIAILNVTQLD